MNTVGFYVIGVGLIFLHFWWEFEVWGYQFGSKETKKIYEEGELQVYKNKNNGFWNKIFFYFYYVLRKRILAKLGIMVVSIGLLIQIIK